MMENMAKKRPRPRRQFTADFKAEIALATRRMTWSDSEVPLKY
ncbi:hypothetical protein OHB39_39640 [Streptomyces sp. NBC_00047]|nr:hypothetical protein [Streptomyces sp. NBC_00047]MCX5613554.1 hypothetical protein [Streptomyces sp. NBC_00047]